ncbi:MAG: hypothetical protein NWF07_02725 [Candidatus Bathyarchaeota archaeon]|nr:hypothetical protein [Candidatus Bathyarchaeota archaeon]
MNTKILRMMAMFGAPSSILGALMIYLSITMTPEWTMNQSISALGSGGLGSVVFESGLLMAGSMAMIFSAGLFEFSEKDFLGMIGSGGVLIYGVSVSALGLSLVDFGEYRGYLVYLLFFVVPVSLALLSIHLYKRGLKSYAVLGAVASIISIIPWIMGGPTTATQELMVLIPFSVWQLAIGYHMYKLEPNEKEF